MRTEKIVLNEERNVTLTAYLQEVGGEFQNISKRPAILVLPGGGYQMCSDREADPVALAYLKAGYQAFVLRYSVGEHKQWPNPLNDYEQAMSLIRNKAEEWTLYPDKVAVIGFSAGGHLAGCAAAMSQNRPNAAILGYADLCDADRFYPGAPDVAEAVTHKTCPCFLFSSRTDNIVPIHNTLRFLTALDKEGIAFESHIYAYGPHGFSTADSSAQPQDDLCTRIPNWVPDSIGWLREMFGDFGDHCMTAPKCRPYINTDWQEYLSVDCTYGYLLKHPVSGPMITAMEEQAAAQLSEEQRQLSREMGAIASNMSLRDMLAYNHTPEEVIEQINQQLAQIKNKQ